VDRSKGVTELRITAPSREYASFHILFVGTGSSKIQGDYSLELKARGLEFVKVVPSRKSGAPKPFMMSTTEITNWQWFHVMGETPGMCTGIGGGSELAAVCGLNRPAKKINWYQAATFANALSVREGLKPAYAIEMGREPSVNVKPGANGYRLPTLAEWEAAALIDEPMVPLKERCAIANSLELSGVTIGLNDARNPAEAKTASACDDGFGGLAPVASFAPNKFGLYDMLGNVWEWVWDDQDNKPKVKGGGYSMLIQNLSPTLTETISPDSKGDPLGMRLVRPLK
jgi:formylglycine-generating enzyme required for sulfatase activity